MEIIPSITGTQTEKENHMPKGVFTATAIVNPLNTAEVWKGRGRAPKFLTALAEKNGGSWKRVKGVITFENGRTLADITPETDGVVASEASINAGATETINTAVLDEVSA